MDIERFPRFLLTHVGAAIAGLILAMWCYRTTGHSTAKSPPKPGFSIVLANNTVENNYAPSTNIITDSALWNRAGNFGDGGYCVLKLDGIRFHFDKRFAKITGDLRQLPRLMPFLGEAKGLELLPHKPSSVTQHVTCLATPRITYGGKS